MRKWLRKHLVTILLFLTLFTGLGLIMYPSVSDWWNRFHQSRAITSYVEQVQQIGDERKDSMLKEAADYNLQLAASGMKFILTEEEKRRYGAVLDITGTGVMGYIQINCIGVNLPIYHGTDESVLQVAIGHLAGTSLPVGGISTHCVVSGHRGLPSARLFTDLDKLKEGDTFTITVFDETFTYQVDQIRTMEPTDMTNIRIFRGYDFCTLVTCTPYGVNTHRLLVRGKRIENIKGALVVTPDAIRIPSYIVIPVVLIPMLLLVLILSLVYYGVKKPKPTEEQIFSWYFGEGPGKREKEPDHKEKPEQEGNIPDEKQGMDEK